MTLRHWLWLLYGLLAWTVLTFAWMTGPYDCSVPDAHHPVTCKHG